LNGNDQRWTARHHSPALLKLDRIQSHDSTPSQFRNQIQDNTRHNAAANIFLPRRKSIKFKCAIQIVRNSETVLQATTQVELRVRIALLARSRVFELALMAHDEWK
jgi:hypothetical protein